MYGSLWLHLLNDPAKTPRIPEIICFFKDKEVGDLVYSEINHCHLWFNRLSHVAHG